MADGPIAVIAIGRCDHGDDAAGLVLADVLECHGTPELTIIRTPAARGDVRDALRLHDVVYAVDAMRTGDAPGTLCAVSPRPATSCRVSYPHGARGVSLADVVDAVLCGHRRRRRTGARAASG